MSWLKYGISFLNPVSEGVPVSVKSTGILSGFILALTACFFFYLLCWLITHLVCILDARNVWEFHQSGGRLPLVHLTLASLPSFHPPSPSFNKYVSPWVCARYWAGGWESSSEPTRPFPRLVDLADWSTGLYFPSHLLDQWLFPPKLLQEKYNASYGGSQNSSAWMGKLRIGAGVSTVSSWRTPLKTPVLSQPFSLQTCFSYNFLQWHNLIR